MKYGRFVNTLGQSIHSRMAFVTIFAILLTLSGLATAQVTTPGKHEPDRAHLVVRDPSNFRILQFTDLHFFAGDDPAQHEPRNTNTVQRMKALVDEYHPNLVIATGDLWPENRDGKGEEFMKYAIEQFESLRVPWAYVWGNHDQLADYQVGHKAFRKAKRSLYRGDQTDGNYVIDILNRRHERVAQLVCLNSRGTGLVEKQQQWLKDLSKRETVSIPRFAFFHIPLKQYDDVWASGAASGFKGEIACPETENGSTLPLLKSLGVKACFCGHDHVNDYSGIIDGVELVYGRATGTGGYGTLRFPKGGKLITVDAPNGRCEWQSVTEDGKIWHPTNGERVDFSEKK